MGSAMASSTRNRGIRRASHEGASDALAAALDELYAAPLDAFVARRRELVGKLRAAGEVPASRLVGAVGKPTRTAWGLNQVARRHPELLRAVFEARDVAVAAQKRGDVESVRVATRGYRERVADIVRAARSALLDSGVDASATQARVEGRRIGETLQAAHAEDSATRERLLAGRLTRDIEVEDPFAGLETSAAGAPHREPTGGGSPGPGRARAPLATATRAPDGESRETERERQRALRVERARQEQEKRAKRTRERAIEAARRQVASFEEAARLARSAAEESRFAAQRAHAEAERAKRAAGEADDCLERARAELQALDR